MDIKEYINTHKDYINYCEAIIYPDGSIEDAIPSHTEKLIEITKEDRDILCDKMPIEAGPVAWLVDYTNCCSVWYNMGMLPENLTKEQEYTIEKLKEHGILSSDFVATKNFEMRICNFHKIMLTSNDENEIKRAQKELEEITER